MKTIDAKEWKKDLPAFIEKTEAFYSGELSKGDYKGFSGLYGSYAQKGGQSSMLRLRMTAGRVTAKKLRFVADAMKQYNVTKAHFTTCESIQLHDLLPKQIYGIMEAALDADIVTMGGGGDFPRNVMCSPLSGVEKGEYFDVLPWAEAAGAYLMNFIKAEKMPRKLKVCFSNSPANIPHATFRDLGFAAREDGKFDVYSAGGLGNNPLFGVKVAEAVEPERILYYIKAMWLTFRAYGNYENRGKARTRYMQEICGGPEKYKEAFLGKLQEVLDSGEDLTLDASEVLADSAAKKAIQKSENVSEESIKEYSRILAQKQPGLYTVIWHPIGGQPKMENFCQLADTICGMEAAEMRLAPDETAYIINLTLEEAKQVIEITKDTAESLFETSVSCIGASVCQVGVRDSQALLAACVTAVRTAKLPDGALPQIHISGCPSSCGTHQTGALGFRGAAKKIDGKVESAFMLYVNGDDRQGYERMGEEYGTILESRIPEFLVKLGQTVAAAQQTFDEWIRWNPEGIRGIAAEYTAE